MMPNLIDLIENWAQNFHTSVFFSSNTQISMVQRVGSPIDEFDNGKQMSEMNIRGREKWPRKFGVCCSQF